MERTMGKAPRARGLYAGLSALAITVALGLGACSGSADDDEQSEAVGSQSDSSGVVLETKDGLTLVTQETDGGFEGIVSGTLATNDQGCVIVETDGSAASVLVTPLGSTVQSADRVSIDGHGEFALGDEVSLTGGYATLSRDDVDASDPLLTCFPDDATRIDLAYIAPSDA